MDRDALIKPLELQYYARLWHLLFTLATEVSSQHQQALPLSRAFETGAQNDSECPPALELARRIETCLTPINALTADAELFNWGGLTGQGWNTSCQAYHESAMCMRKLMKYCEGSENDELQIGEAMLIALQAGKRHNCDNPAVYEAYQRHSKCYTSIEGATVRCINAFTESMEQADAMYADMVSQQDGEEEYSVENSDAYTKELCGGFDDLMRCVDGAISSRCGRDAANLFVDAMRNQIPDIFNEMCSARRHRQSGNRSAHFRSNTWIILAPILYLNLICINY
ncbi:hypothetical protein CAPTEDRAFT_224940 [Capitella teleta]|uniref:DUF19 domain-containing protein n=1 Tax=Capitella teleta TaxID=283909 RepID=R7U3W6_CAPTE|nr:hypothetical protein CAPTEDRAFT_224940 [Capitella teleta]|eukprot:ELT98356.1 hypothetical protein CAPTEDRAFT_224940 [Capitella teleta]